MSLSRASYRLKRFVNSSDPDFAGALRVYARNISPSIRTNTNEITSWLDNRPKTFTGEFYVFGFYLDRKIVGFAEASYFAHRQIFVCDYIVVDEPYRRHGVFFEFIDQLRANLEAIHPEYRYATAEVAYGTGEEYPSHSSRLLERLLKLIGFRVIRAPYFQPRLAINDVESEMPSDLLVFSREAGDRMHTETYLQIVRTIYYEYYLPWYSTGAETAKAYKKILDRLFAEIQNSLRRKKHVAVNGHSLVLPGPAPPPAYTSQKSILVFSAQSIVIVVALMAAMSGLRLLFHLSDQLFLATSALAVLTFLAIAGIVSKEARIVFTHATQVTKALFGREGNDSTPNDEELEQIPARGPDER